MPADFRTEILLQKYPFRLGYDTPVMLCGSCFTEYIGNIMHKRKFPVLVNPFGVVYNPISIKLVIDRILNETHFKPKELNYRNGLWFSYLHHTSFSLPDKATCLQVINDELARAVDFIKGVRFLLITFGTARVYYLKENNEPVANCHKIPSQEFENRLLNVDEIFVEWTILLNKIFSLNKKLKVIFTVSPVRHWKDGPQGNQLSKSILHVAVNELIKNDPERLFYFPAYEIMMDDLRDYRFYSDDMLHPSLQAVDYIWNKFNQSAFDHASIKLMKEVEKVLDAVSHRPFNPKTPEHKTFINNTLKKIYTIKKENPDLDFSDEESYLFDYLK